MLGCAAAVLLASAVPNALAGIAIGASIRAVVELLGPPADVTSLDAGNRFTFGRDTAAYVDDDGRVLAVETRAGSPVIRVDDTLKTFAVGTYTVAQAEAELADVAEFAGGALRSYRIEPRRDLVLRFAASNRLEQVAYGEPGQLARLGLLPGDAASKAVPYRTPVVRGTPLAPPPVAGSRLAVYRLDIDRGGAITRVEIVAPPGAFIGGDDDVARGLRTRRYWPATFGGRPIAATVFTAVHY